MRTNRKLSWALHQKKKRNSDRTRNRNHKGIPSNWRLTSNRRGYYCPRQNKKQYSTPTAMQFALNSQSTRQNKQKTALSRLPSSFVAILHLLTPHPDLTKSEKSPSQDHPHTNSSPLTTNLGKYRLCACSCPYSKRPDEPFFHLQKPIQEDLKKSEFR